MQIDANEVVAGYRNDLAAMTERALVAEAQVRIMQKRLTEALNEDDGKGSQE